MLNPNLGFRERNYQEERAKMENPNIKMIMGISGKKVAHTIFQEMAMNGMLCLPKVLVTPT